MDLLAERRGYWLKGTQNICLGKCKGQFDGSRYTALTDRMREWL
ncbi:hypothetical protein J27TS7_51650 [Paenibacillus dendritiformis]|nr:hypothetical protein J27TS7_51650 [Paenibacillus dendritiformis]